MLAIQYFNLKKMKKLFSLLHEELNRVFNFLQTKVLPFLSHAFDYIVYEINPFCHHLFYYLVVSTLGYFWLRVTKGRSSASLTRNHDLDLFFTSVSATTSSSMSTLEMELFSNTQLMILVILMLSGGEVFVSILGLHLRKLKHKKRARKTMLNSIQVFEDEGMKYRSLRALGHVVMGYLLVSHILGYSLISLYISITSSASNVLEKKGIESHIFSLFTTVSTFSNCGFIPTNENMVVFKRNSVFLLILIPQILMGNKLYPCCLRLVIWVLEKFTRKDEYSYMLNNYKELGYGLLTSRTNALLLAMTAIVLIMVQFVAFCILEWNSVALEGLNWQQKWAGSLFQTVNSRHSGESIVDFSLISPATLVLFVVMMYLPPQTTFVPIGYDNEPSLENNSHTSTKHNSSFAENFNFSQLSYLAIFVMVICITEWQSLQEDPLNFNVFNIVIEVVSAYGNVGYSMGYSCERRLEKRHYCINSYAGFASRWSKEGKLVLILVMIFGRLKKFNFNAGKAWNLSF